MDRIKVMIVDDHEVVRLGLRAALDTERDLEVVGDFGDAKAALREAGLVRPDVVLMDVRMPGTDGIEACRLLRSSLPEIKVVMLTSYRDEQAVFAAIMSDEGGGALPSRCRHLRGCTD